MIQVTHDDDGTLMVSIPAGEHALRERVLMLALQEIARPTTAKGMADDVVEAAEPEEAPPRSKPSKPRKAPLQAQQAAEGAPMRDRIISVLRDIAPCSPGAMWRALGLKAAPGPSHRAVLNALKAEGLIELTGNTATRTITLTDGVPS